MILYRQTFVNTQGKKSSLSSSLLCKHSFLCHCEILFTVVLCNISFLESFEFPVNTFSTSTLWNMFWWVIQYTYLCSSRMLWVFKYPKLLIPDKLVIFNSNDNPRFEELINSDVAGWWLKYGMPRVVENH